MLKLNTKFIATVRPFNGSTDNPATEDKNGEMPVILNVVAGIAPNARVLSGTVAKNAGFTVGKSYLVNSVEGEPDAEYGRRFQFDATMEITNPMVIIEASGENNLGAPKLVDVTSKVNENAKGRSI